MAKKNEIAKAPPVHPAVQVKHWLTQRSDALAEWCSESIDPMTLIRVGARLVAKESKFQNPKTWPSLYMALITAAQLGLEPEGPRGEAYLIPYWDRDAGCELVQLMPGYRGIMRLVCNSPDVRSIRSQVVHEGDEFSMNLMDPDDPASNFHRVCVGVERGAAIGVYSRVTYADGSHDCEFANWSEVDKARSSAKGKSPAWEKWPEQMARKFIIKRHANQLPLDSVAHQAILVDNISSDSAFADARNVIDVDGKLEGTSVPTPALPAASGLAAKLEHKSSERKKASAQSAKKSRGKPSDEKAPPVSAGEESRREQAESDAVGDAFNLCGLCGEPTDDELCAECASAGEGV